MAAAGGDLAPSLDADIDELVDYMLFEGEPRLREPLEGTTTFSRTFAARAPRDASGRSLRQFDLRTRLFRYRLSYTIYSAQFDALPAGVQARVFRGLFDRLTRTRGTEGAASIEILKATKPGLPEYWRAHSAPSP
jgi:hypothetical protein